MAALPNASPNPEAEGGGESGWLGEDGGEATVEFLGTALVLLIPLVYLIVVLAQLQAASFAVVAATEEASRLLNGSPDSLATLEAASALVFADYGFAPDTYTFTLDCLPDCATAGAQVRVSTQVRVELPLLPDFVNQKIPLQIPVSAEHNFSIGPWR